MLFLPIHYRFAFVLLITVAVLLVIWPKNKKKLILLGCSFVLKELEVPHSQANTNGNYKCMANGHNFFFFG